MSFAQEDLLKNADKIYRRRRAALQIKKKKKGEDATLKIAEKAKK